MVSLMHARTIATAALLLAACMLGGCETTGAPTPQAAAAPQPTHQEAALDCWMGTENLARTMSLDQRADVVDKCIADKMSGKPAPMLGEAKPAAKPPAKPKTAQSESDTGPKTATAPAGGQAAKP